MREICIICVYFGELPASFSFWLNSCSTSPKINFLLVTDQKVNRVIDNVTVIKMEFQEFVVLVANKLDMEVCIPNPYKCCDFRPAYGVIFEDYLRGYYYWGHCDMDLVFGDIDTLLPSSLVNQYDKILPLGHLSLYKNTKECNYRFMEQGDTCCGYKHVFTSSENFSFDEICGIYAIYKKNQFKMYDKFIFADITPIYKRFRISDRYIKSIENNYHNQIFYWEKGKAFRAYVKNDEIFTQEFLYTHFQKRTMKYVNINVSKDSCFFVTKLGFIEKKPGIPTLDDINKYNPYRGTVYESIELLHYKLCKLFQRVKRKLKNMISKDKKAYKKSFIERTATRVSE